MESVKTSSQGVNTLVFVLTAFHCAVNTLSSTVPVSTVKTAVDTNHLLKASKTPVRGAEFDRLTTKTENIHRLSYICEQYKTTLRLAFLSHVHVASTFNSMHVNVSRQSM